MAAGMQIDQETALKLVKAGGTLLLLDVPPFTLFGIDTQMFSVGPNFKGVKMIPPGPHFVYYCSSNKEGLEFSPAISFFLTIHSSEIIVRKWHPKEEQLIKVAEDEECKYSEMVKQMEFDHYLGPYPLDHYGSWKHLSSYISKATISRIEPIGPEVTLANETTLSDQEQNVEMERSMMQLEDSNFSDCSSEKTGKRRFYFTTIPKVVMLRNITGEMLTALNLDKTKLLENILASNFGGEEDLLLGELQFSFIAFMMGQSLEAFIQWKDLVNLFFSCTDAPLLTRSQLFTKEFFPLVLDSEVIDGDLLLWTKKLKKLLETTLGWDFVDVCTNGIGDEDDEYAPVVVPLDEATPMSHEGQAS